MTDSADFVALRDPKTLWPWLRGFLAAFCATVLCTGFLSVAYLRLSGGDPMYTPEDLVDINVTLGMAAIALCTSVIFIICVILTMRITYRMMKNAHALNSTYAEIGPAWAVWSYFVPFANLIFPVRAVGQIWRATFAELDGAPPPDPNGAIGLWWAFWIGGNMLDNVAARLTGEGIGQTPHMPTPTELVAAQALTGLAAVAAAIAALLMIPVFGKLVRAQTRLVEARG